MIRKFKTLSDQEITIYVLPNNTYKYKWCSYDIWTEGNEITFSVYLSKILALGWKEVNLTSGPAVQILNAAVDPNDIQPKYLNCPHVYDITTDTRKLCNKGWSEILWDTNGAGGSKPCCGGGLNNNMPAMYKGGRWHDADCDTLKPPAQAQMPQFQGPMESDYRSAGSKKGLCTCGSSAVGSDRHSSWCDVK